jgi:hypothetical protein
MSNLYSKNTGIEGYTLWISTKTGREKHGIRVKVENNKGEIASFSVSDIPEILKKSKDMKINSNDLKNIKEFIIKNKKTLLKHWEGEYDSSDLINNIQKI